MPREKVPCPECGQPKSAVAKLCLACSQPYKRTAEHRQVLSNKLKGRQQRGTGWHHSESSKRKMAAHWTPERREAKRLEQQLHYENYDNRMHIALALAGKNNPNYQGKNTSVYGPGYGAKYAKMLREQKWKKCQLCGKTDCWLHLHHKDFGTIDHSPENLACLCVSCHRRVHIEHRKAQMA